MDERLLQAVRRLTIAVWALAAVLAVFAGIYLLAVVRREAIMSSFATYTPAIPASAKGPPPEKWVDLSSLPLERQIAAASVIAVGRYKRDGDREICVLSEILKVSPGTTFYYAQGDELRELSHVMKPNESHGDGQLIFFVGSPATFSLSMSFDGDRVSGLGDMPLDLLRKKIAAVAK